MTMGRYFFVIFGAVIMFEGWISGGPHQSAYQPPFTPPLLAQTAHEAEPEFALAAINRDIGPGETVWHVRAALNVASLSCPGGAQSPIAANYNAMLKRHRGMLAQAYAAEQAAYRKRFGRNWQRHSDTHMTRLYTFFTKPMALNRFCAIALDVTEKTRVMSSGELESYAPKALALLERPFVSTVSASRPADLK